jgi:hypothetical protein
LIRGSIDKAAATANKPLDIVLKYLGGPAKKIMDAIFQRVQLLTESPRPLTKPVDKMGTPLGWLRVWVGSTDFGPYYKASPAWPRTNVPVARHSNHFRIVPGSDVLHVKWFSEGAGTTSQNKSVAAASLLQ